MNGKTRLYQKIRKLRGKVSETETIQCYIEQAIEPKGADKGQRYFVVIGEDAWYNFSVAESDKPEFVEENQNGQI